MAKKILLGMFLAALVSLVHAQESANYKIEQGTFNNGGVPPPELSSASYKMTLDSIGEGIVVTGMESASYGIDSGFPSDYPPPGEVSNLLFNDGTTLAWDSEPSVGGYNLYRGDVTDLPGTCGTKVQSGVSSPTTNDSQTPSPNQCLIYVVTVSNRLGEEGTKGTDSSGTPRN